MRNSDVKLLERLLRETGRTGGASFSDLEVHRFLLYYELVLKWNPRLHLTTLVDPLLFFQRHLLESDFAVSLLSSEVSGVWDLGSGLGIPGIPVAILRPTLGINLVEAKRHRAFFLEETINSLELRDVKVLNVKIESLEHLPARTCGMARAVEKMAELIPEIIRLGEASSQLLLFGAISLVDIVKAHMPESFEVESHQLPNSDNRYILNVFRST